MAYKTINLALTAMLTAASLTPALAEPGGCLKYGAAGAVGGHLAHHGVLGAAGGCAAGMYVRHRFRKEAHAKAALYDQEHPGSSGTYQQKATAYDVEHSTSPASGTPAGATPSATPAPAQNPL